MKLLRLILGLLALATFVLPVQAAEIYNLDLHRFRVTQKLHEEIGKNFTPDQYQLKLTLEGQKRIRYEGEGIEVRKLNQQLPEDQKLLPEVTDVLGEVDFEITQANVELTLTPAVEPSKIEELRVKISQIAGLVDSRGDYIQITAALTQTQPAEAEEKLNPEPTQSVTLPETMEIPVPPLRDYLVQAKKIVRQGQHMVMPWMQSTQKQIQTKPAWLAGGSLMVFALAAGLIFRKKRGAKDPQTTPVNPQTTTAVDMMSALQAEEAQAAFSLYQQIQEQAKSTIPQTPTFEQSRQENPAPQTTQRFADLPVDPVPFAVDFGFLGAVRGSQMKSLLEGESNAVRAWILKSLHPRLAEAVFERLSTKDRKDLAWELSHLSLFEQTEVEAIAARLQAKLGLSTIQTKPAETTPSLTVHANHSPKVAPAVVEKDFEILTQLPKNLLQDLCHQVGLEDLLIAASHGSKNLREKIILALDQERRRAFLLSQEKVRPTLEDSLIHQEIILKRLAEIADHRRLDLKKFKGA